VLVVRRRAGQSILIGEEVEIQVLEIGPARVKLGVTAPAAIPVVRSEVRLTREENLAAARRLSPEKLAAFASTIRGKPAPAPARGDEQWAPGKNL